MKEYSLSFFVKDDNIFLEVCDEDIILPEESDLADWFDILSQFDHSLIFGTMKRISYTCDHSTFVITIKLEEVIV